jgi:hypothetical protein
MMLPNELNQQVLKFKTLLSHADNSEILAYADELLLFLNRLQDFLRRGLKKTFPISSIDDIIYRLESYPDVTLQDKSVRARLLNLFMKL